MPILLATTSDKLDVIGVYRSQEGSVTNLITQLQNLISGRKTTIIGGDFNICTLSHPNNCVFRA